MNLRVAEKLLFFLCLLFLPTQLGLHLWPQFAYVFSLRIDYLSPTIYFWDLLVVGLISVWILQRPKVNKLAFNILFVFILTQIFSLFINLSLGVGLVRLEQYLISGLLGLYLSSKYLEKIKPTLFAALAISLISQCLIAFGQFLISSTLGLWIIGERSFNISTPSIAKFDYLGREFLRPYGTFPHPNVLGGFLAIILPLLNLVKADKFKGLYFITTVFGFFTSFLTVSRIAIIATVAEGAFLIRSRGLFILVGILIIIFPVLYTRFSSLINFDVLSLDRREEQLGLALDILSKNPLFGVGLNNFIPYAASNLIAGPSRFLQPVHNIYLLELVETGIVGFLGLLLLIFYPINILIKKRSSKADLLLFSWVIILFLGMFDHYLLTLPQGIRVLFLIWGVSLSHYKW